MTTEDHEMESGSSMGNDDDTDFVPKFISRKSRTESVLQAVRSVVTSRVASPPEDPGVGRDSKCDTGSINLFSTSKLIFHVSVFTTANSGAASSADHWC